MRVKIEKCSNPDWWYAKKVGREFEVKEDDDDPNDWTEIEEGWNLLKSDCTIIPDEPGNRVPFVYEQWKEKGGRVWYDGRHVSQLAEFDVNGGKMYAGVCVGNVLVSGASDLTMSAPDEVWYCNVYTNKISSGHRSIEECRKVNLVTPLHILEINITKGTCKVVHNYQKSDV